MKKNSIFIFFIFSIVNIALNFDIKIKNREKLNYENYAKDMYYIVLFLRILSIIILLMIAFFHHYLTIKIIKIDILNSLLNYILIYIFCVIITMILYSVFCNKQGKQSDLYRWVFKKNIVLEYAPFLSPASNIIHLTLTNRTYIYNYPHSKLLNLVYRLTDYTVFVLIIVLVLFNNLSGFIIKDNEVGNFLLLLIIDHLIVLFLAFINSLQFKKASFNLIER